MAGRCSKADAIVVLGCRGPTGLRRRLEIGIRLFDQGAAPLLVLSGGGGGPTPEAELMRRHIPGSEMRVIAKSGHYAAWEQPEDVGRLLRQFLDGLS